MATAGHVDHGKSTLVRALTGTDPDRWDEEKRRGLTIDLGFAWTELPSGVAASFVDVPGHVRFLPNMLAGVGAVAGCLFVVAATDGWMPQSEEHLRILDVLGTVAGVVALTKVGDLDQDTVELAGLEVSEHLAGTFLEGAPVVAVDAPKGLGLGDLRASLDRMVSATPEPADRDRPRLWVDRSFSASGAGTIVTGTLTGGPVRIDDQLEVVPLGPTGPVRVRGIQTHGADVEVATPGHRVALNLSGLGRHQIGRGQALVRLGQWEPSRLIDAGLSVLPGLDHPVTRRGAFLMHVGTHAATVEVQLLGGLGQVRPGERGQARIRLPAGSALPLLPGDRFVIREAGRDETVAGGQVLDVAPVLRPGRARPDPTVDRVIRERGWVEPALLERLTGDRRPASVGRWVVSEEARAAAEAALREAVATAGPLGLDASSVDDKTRALLPHMADLEVTADRVRRKGAGQETPAAARWVAELESQPFSPPPPDPTIPRPMLRDLVRRSIVVEADGLFFHRTAIDQAARTVAALLSDKADGVTVAEVREALGTSRKWAMPLLTYLDSTGVTRRRGDVRVGGPRLPESDGPTGPEALPEES
ncbi:MAG TPA: selenocysteine-specific translation elongation factor [Acidimicrobiales bacterium]|nr:selenocysteine-specific translation elongation factor [Acidimicrobiales bacterium]